MTSLLLCNVALWYSVYLTSGNLSRVQSVNQNISNTGLIAVSYFSHTLHCIRGAQPFGAKGHRVLYLVYSGVKDKIMS